MNILIISFHTCPVNKLGEKDTGGLNLYVHQLSEQLGEKNHNVDINFEQIVEKISYGTDRVTVTSNGTNHTAHRVVVTLPLGVLKRGAVGFFPELPDAKLQAINRLEMGILNKIAMRFPDCFWPESTHFFGMLGNSHRDVMNIVNMTPHVEQPILVALTYGDYARTLEMVTDFEMVSTVLEDLRTIFGSGVPDPTAVAITRWNSDPFALGRIHTFRRVHHLKITTL